MRSPEAPAGRRPSRSHRPGPNPVVLGTCLLAALVGVWLASPAVAPAQTTSSGAHAASESISVSAEREANPGATRTMESILNRNVRSETLLARSLSSLWASTATVLVDRLGDRLMNPDGESPSIATDVTTGLGTGLLQTGIVYSIGTSRGGNSGLATLLGTAAGSAAGLSAMYAIVRSQTGASKPLGLTLVGAGSAAVAPVLGFELAHAASRMLRADIGGNRESLQIAPTASVDLEDRGGTVGVEVSY